jgi:hypothetical protein
MRAATVMERGRKTLPDGRGSLEVRLSAFKYFGRFAPLILIETEETCAA